MLVIFFELCRVPEERPHSGRPGWFKDTEP